MSHPDDPRQAGATSPWPAHSPGARDTAGGEVPAPVPPAPPPAAGRYALGPEIARGAMGAVYRATDTTLGREVAVKALQDRYAPGSGAARRFADEARITAQLQHPAIPPVHDLGTLPDGRPFLAMKLIKGETLADLLATRPDPGAGLGRFVAVFEQVCQAVAYAHAHGVIHRDLKPANVMVGAFGEVQLMDWGLAKVLGAGPDEDADPEATSAATAVVSLRDSDGGLTEAGSVLGTPAFMPPEQAAGAVGLVDRRSDVFGLGAILAVILTGRPPFTAPSAESTRVKAARADVAECLARLDACGAEPGLVALCKSCLSPRAEDRPPDGGAVAQAVATLRQAAEGRARSAELERVRAEGERLAAELREAEGRRRRRAQRGLAGAVGLLLLAGLGFGWWRAEQGRAERERQARNAEAVAGLLEQCEQALGRGDAAGAAVTLEAAERRAAEGGAEGQAGRLGRCRDDLALLRELEAVDEFRWTPQGKEFPPAGAVAARYREALGPFGLDPEAAGAEEAAARASGSAVRARVVGAWDRLLAGRPSEGVRSALRAADPDPFRDRVRDAVRAKDRAALARLAGRAEALAQPPAFAAFLAGQVGSKGRRRALLRGALRRRPGDLGLLMALGGSYPINRREGAQERARWFQAAVAVAPDNGAAHTGLGVALHDNKDLDGAIAQFREALRLRPKDAVTHNNLANALRGKGDLGGAIALCEEALRLNPKDAAAHTNLGAALYDKKDFGGAIAHHREALRLDPKSPWAHLNLAEALYARGDRDGAITHYREAARLDPEYAPSHYNLANALREKKDLEGAITHYREALRLDPKNSEVHNNLGNALRENGEVREGTAHLREALRLDPRNAAAHFNLGAALYDKGDLEGAITHFREGLRLDPKNSGVHNNLGNALGAKGDRDGAMAHYREALRLDPRSASPHFNLANALYAGGDRDGAIAHYREALRLNPEWAPAHNNLGAALRDKGDVKGAIAHYREAIRIDPRHAGAHANLGTALQSQGDLEGAIAQFREALRLNPKEAMFHGKLGDALQVKGDLEGAIAQYQEALRLDPKLAPAASASLRRAQGLRELLRRLPDVLAGKQKLKSPAETCVLAALCAQPFRQRYADAARLFADAFAADPRLAEDFAAGHRYNAACAAALAGCGKGKGAAKLGEEERARWRKQAREWLRADLALWAKRAQSTRPEDRAAAGRTLRHWREDPDLAGVRDKRALLKLPERERRAWQDLWAEVDGLLGKAGARP